MNRGHVQAVGIFAVLAALLGTGACAARSPAGTPMFRRDIGAASAPDVIRLAGQVIERYGYVVDIFDDAQEIRIQTHWRHRTPFEDEASAGITGAETRLLIVARMRSQTDLGPYYNITFTMENRFGVAGGPAWNSVVDSPHFRAYAEGIANDLRQLVSDVGVRRLR